ncbi:MAG: hypothetical protein ACKVTZ_10710 [Bacteroidia bacterium]
MTSVQDVFCEIPCLTERSKSLSGLALQKKWFKGADKRIIGQYLQKFVDYNSKYFSFLGVTPIIIGTDQNTSIQFRTSSFIGSIPLRSPDTGKQIGDFVITPKFSGKDRYADYIEILNLLQKEISPEIADSLPLVSGRNFQPPLYLEAQKFVIILTELLKTQWKKFSRIEKVLPEPVGQVDWNKYSVKEYLPENRLKFYFGKNILSEFHDEYSNLRYVFDLCKKELLSSNTPQNIKLSISKQLEFAEEKLYYHKPISTKEISIRFSDTPLIKNAKKQANKILNNNLNESTAWRVDFANVFEKFTQYIFTESAKEIGGRFLSNYKFKGYSDYQSSWQLSHLEPDGIFQKNETCVMIDAKYKSHLYNRFDSSEILKEEHRHDLHQILGYNSFNTSATKFGFLCYPSTEVQIDFIKYQNPINQTSNRIAILGIPMTKESIHQTKKVLSQKLNDIEKYNGS